MILQFLKCSNPSLLVEEAYFGFVTLMLPIGSSVGVLNEWSKMIMKMRLFGLNQIQLLSRVLGTHLRTGFQPRPMPSIIIQMWLWTQSWHQNMFRHALEAQSCCCNLCTTHYHFDYSGERNGVVLLTQKYKQIMEWKQQNT